MKHDHTCHCGTASATPHETREQGCVRHMVDTPTLVTQNTDPDANRWLVEGSEITEFSMKQQRGYHKHPCGCWSRWPGSSKSIDA